MQLFTDIVQLSQICFLHKSYTCAFLHNLFMSPYIHWCLLHNLLMPICQTLSVPDPPYNLVVRSESSMVIRVQWHPPVNMNGVFSHYQIHCQGCQSEKQHSTVETSALLDVYGDTKVSVSVRTCLKNHGLVSSFAGPVTIHTPIARKYAEYLMCSYF